MRQGLHSAMALLLALGAAGCGELENAPFREGTVHGRLTVSDPAVALVSVLGAPKLRAALAPDGAFRLEHVPAGPAELFIIASADKALRLPLVVPGGQSLSVGELVPKPASFLALHVKAPHHQRVAEARVSLVGTPSQGLALGESGRLRVGPLPDGCYVLAVSLPGFPEVSSETCVSADEQKEVKVNLPVPDSGKGHTGCAQTGCAGGFLCNQEGQCVECFEDAQCAPGFSCHHSRCEGDGPACASCAGDWQCRSGTDCREVPEGGTACVESCKKDGDCEPGFTCQGGQCLPDTARFSGCRAYRQVGAACEGDARCRELGIVNGLCLEARCTFACASDKECPESFSCRASTAGTVCQHKP